MNPLKDWNRFLFGPISARPLGAFRIVFGVLILIYLALMTVEFDHWYTGAGLLQGTEAREAAGPFRFSPLQYVNDPTDRPCLPRVHGRGRRRLHSGLAHPADEHSALPVHALALPPQCLRPTAARTPCR